MYTLRGFFITEEFFQHEQTVVFCNSFFLKLYINSGTQRVIGLSVLKVYYPYWIKIWTMGISYTCVWN